MIKSKNLLLMAAFLGLVPASAWAAALTVTSYSMPNGGTGSYIYQDTTYSNCPGGNCTTTGAALSGGLGRLTNGVLPTLDWNVNANSAGWIGWSSDEPNGTNPTVTFNFAGNSTINSVSIVVDNSLGYGGVNAPSSVTIDGTKYTITASSTEGPQTVNISGLNLTGSNATVQFSQGPNVWIMIGQVSFSGIDGASPTPEPGSTYLIGGGLLAGLVALKLKRGNRGLRTVPVK